MTDNQNTPPVSNLGVLEEIKYIACTAGAPNHMPVPKALARILSLCNRAGVTKKLDELRGEHATNNAATPESCFLNKENTFQKNENIAPVRYLRSLPSAEEIDGMIDRLLDAQQDINLSANETMSQPLCDASALIDELEKMLHRVRAVTTEGQTNG